MRQSFVSPIVAALAIVAPTSLVRAQVAPDSSSITRLVMLGTGTPNPDPNRSGPAVAVVVRDTPYLFDAGTGVVRRAAAAAAKGVSGLAVTKLSRVFLTHLHSDHTIGLPDLMTTPWILGRAVPLSVLGPPGTKAMVAKLAEAYSADRQMRRFGGEPSVPNGYEARGRDVAPGVVYRDSNVTITAFRVKHGSWRDAYGYRVQTPDRVIVISGDTRASDAIVTACNGCDILVHEVYSAKALESRPAAWQAYHSKFHTAGTDLGKIAAAARPRLLVLYHQLNWGARDDSELLDEVRATFKGRVVSANDLDVF